MTHSLTLKLNSDCYFITYYLWDIKITVFKSHLYDLKLSRRLLILSVRCVRVRAPASPFIKISALNQIFQLGLRARYGAVLRYCKPLHATVEPEIRFLEEAFIGGETAVWPAVAQRASPPKASLPLSQVQQGGI